MSAKHFVVLGAGLLVLLGACGSAGPAAPPASPRPTATGLSASVPAPARSPHPPTAAAVAGQLPYDLLFLSGEALMYWDNTAARLDQAADQVVAISASADGRRVAMLRALPPALTPTPVPYPPGGEGPSVPTYELALLDVDGGQTTVLARPDPAWRIERPMLELSPDGRYVAYIVERPLESLRAPGLSAPAASPPAGGGVRGAVYVLSTDGARGPVEAGTCGDDSFSCEGLSWSPDSTTLVWSDAAGLWACTPGSAPGPARLVIPPSAVEPDASTYRLQSWSPSGRYLLAWVTFTSGKLSRLAVLDLAAGRASELPGPYDSGWFYLHATWLHDDRLLSTHADPAGRQLPPVGDLWHVDAGSELVQDARFPLPVMPLDPIDYTQTAASRLPGRRIVMVASQGGQSGLYLFDVNTYTAQQLNAFSTDWGSSGLWRLLWSPDGAGVLLADWDGDKTRARLYVPVNGSAPIDVREVLGARGRDFVWVTKAP